MLCRNWHQTMLLSHTNKIVGGPGNGEIGNNFFRAILGQFVTFENIIISGFQVKILDTCFVKKVYITLKQKFLFWRMPSRIRKQTKSDHASGLSRDRQMYLYRNVRPYFRPQHQDDVCSPPTEELISSSSINACIMLSHFEQSFWPIIF